MAEKLMKYADATKKYDVVFGLETHVELSTNTKLFCPAHIAVSYTHLTLPTKA